MNRAAGPASGLHRTLGWAVALLLVLAPLPFAGRTPEASALLCAAACATGLMALAETRGRVAVPAGGALAAFCLLSLLTVVPLPAPVVLLLNPVSAATQQAALAAPGEPGATFLTLSSAPSATAATLGRLGAALALFFAACCAGRDSAGRRLIASGLVASGLLQAVLGLVMFVQDRNRIFGYTREAWLGRLTGTYINPNHFAGLIELAAPLALAMLLGMVPPLTTVRAGGRGRIAAALSDRRSPLRLLLAGSLVLMLVALLLSRSRSGVLLCAAALCPPLLVSSWNRSGQSRAARNRAAGGRPGASPGRRLSVRLALAAAVVVLSVGLVVVLSGGGELSRLSGSARQAPTDLLAPGGRLDAWERAAPILADHPLTGSGLGTFMDLFPRYRGPGIRFRYEELHNDWLQLAVETGLAGALLIALALAMAVSAAWSARGGGAGEGPGASAREEAGRLLRIGALGGACALLVHEAFDFNLQIPANALAFAAIAALCCAGASGAERSRPRALADRASAAGPRVSASLLFGLVATLLAAWGAWRPSERSIEDLAAGQAAMREADRALADPLGNEGHPEPGALISRAGEFLARAARGNPAKPETHLALARLERLIDNAAVVSLGAALSPGAAAPLGEAGPRRVDDAGAWRLALAASLDPWRADLRADLLAERLARGDLGGAIDDLRALAARGGEPLARALPLLLSAEPAAEEVERAILDGARARGEVGEGDGWGDARLLYSDALVRSGRPAQSVAWLRRMIESRDSPAHLLAGSYHRWLAASPETAGSSEAVPTGRALLDRTPGAPAAERATLHSGLARALMSAGDPCGAAAEAAEALLLLPAQPGVRFQSAEYSLACGRAEEAARAFEYLLRGGAEAAFVSENAAGLRSGLARAYELLGRREEALREWREVARLAPDDAVARDRILMIESGL